MRRQLIYRWLLILILAVLCCLVNPVKAQPLSYLEKCKVIQPEWQPLKPAELLFLSNQINGKIQPLSLPYVLPVVVHIVHSGGLGNISDAQVISGINSLNVEFSNNSPEGQSIWGVDMEIQFCLATVDPNGNPTTGIMRYDGDTLPVSNYSTYGIDAGGAISHQLSSAVRWNTMEYYNIYLVTEINDNGGGFGIQAYAYYPTTWNNLYDGTYQLYNTWGTVGNLKSYTSLNKVATHELGHAFYLYHTFEAMSCTVDGDLVADTPPTTGQGSNNLCNMRDCNNTQMIENYMDYTHQNCQNTFTQGQKVRAHNAATMYQRYSQLNSNKCQLISTTDPEFTISEDTLCIDEWVQFGSVTAGATSLEWTMPGGFKTTANTTTAYTYYTSTGTKNVTLKVNGSDSITKQVLVINCPPVSHPFAENHLGDSLKLKFTTNRGVKLLGNSKQFGQEAAASICDWNGNIQWYTNSRQVHNSLHVLQPFLMNGSMNATNYSTTQSASIIHLNNYYFFPGSDAPSQVYSYNNGFRFYDTSGNLNTATINYPDCEGRTLIQHGNGVDFWLVGKVWHQSNVIAYLFNGNLNTPPVLSISHDGNQSLGSYGIGQIKSNRDGTMVAFSESSTSTVYLYNFDRCSGILTYNKQFSYVSGGYSGSGYGVSFDHTGNYLYTTGNLYLVRWNIATSASQVLATGGWVYTFGQLELAPPPIDTIFVARLGLSYLSAVYGTAFIDEALISYSPSTINCRFGLSQIIQCLNSTNVCGGPLPVELISFTGENKGSYNLLEWVTGSEFNSDYFTLEKLIPNNILSPEHWTEIVQIKAAGYANSDNYYSFKDYNVLISNIYRLKQVDFDGNINTFKERIIINLENKDTKIIQVYDMWSRELFEENEKITMEKVDQLDAGCYVLKFENGFKKYIVK